MSINIASIDNYQELVKEGFVIVDFYTDFCAPCKRFAKILDDVDFEMSFVNIVKVNATHYPELAERFDIKASPTVLFYKDNVIVEQHVGVIEMEPLKEKIASYIY
ncbi:thioredoxin family protein [Bacillus sp. NSP9.1]|uniref:thioredoxin family protein n=1 Tax=Bacillus sp. NSP9.1 TaxID=1071078 RepID=UPI00040CBCD2|nr:thioredoxin family protein [Bacillus sp. NSP9.1]QHZ47123.1 thioredoxin family protein [Bacillus sp. NSP9.1]